MGHTRIAVLLSACFLIGTMMSVNPFRKTRYWWDEYDEEFDKQGVAVAMVRKEVNFEIHEECNITTSCKTKNTSTYPYQCFGNFSTPCEDDSCEIFKSCFTADVTFRACMCFCRERNITEDEDPRTYISRVCY